MKRLIYVLIGISFFLLLLSCQGKVQPSAQQTETPAVITSPAPPAQSLPSPDEIPPPPRVSRQRLQQDLSTLATERVNEAQRQDARRYIEDVLNNAGWQIQEQAFSKGVNIVARRPNADPNRRELLIGAHYDTVRGTPGADDNATGVAAALELSRLFQNYAAPKNLAIVLFDLEERGALGSMDYVNQPQNLVNLDGAIILEMLGYTCHTPQCQGIPPELEVTPPSDKGDFLSIIGDTEHPSLINAFRAVSSPLELFSLDVPFKGLLTPILLRSDHAPFWLKGKGAVMVSDTAFLRNPHYHRASDTAATIDLDFFTDSTALVAQATATLLHQP